jgi:hypothetical protein
MAREQQQQQQQRDFHGVCPSSSTLKHAQKSLQSSKLGNFWLKQNLLFATSALHQPPIIVIAKTARIY